MNNLALLRKQQGDLTEAAQMYQRALRIFEHSLAPDHPRLVACRANFAKLQRKRVAANQSSTSLR